MVDSHVAPNVAHLLLACAPDFLHIVKILLDHSADPNEADADIVHFRELHQEMDRVVLDAYGWNDISPRCEFIPEFGDEEDDDENARARKKKCRYRWPDEVHDEVLARLLDLNRHRALAEGRLISEVPPSKEAKDATHKRKASKNGDDREVPLFSAHEGDA